MEQVRQQKAAVAALRASGATILYYSETNGYRSMKIGGTPFGPQWLRTRLGDDFFNHVAVVTFRGGTNYRDDDLRPLQDLPNLRELYVGGSEGDIAALTDAGLYHLRDLKTLRGLSWEGDSQITPQGLRHLAQLVNLKELFMHDEQMSDAWFEPLKPLTSLEQLGAWATHGTPISDKGLEHLSGLSNLRMLYVQREQDQRSRCEEIQ